MRDLAAISYVLATLISTGCYEAPRVISTTPPPEKRLYTLDERGHEQLCASLLQQLIDEIGEDHIAHASCIVALNLAGGFQDPDGVTACKYSYDMCLAQRLHGQAELITSECEDEQLGSCVATVGEYRQCELDSTADTVANFEANDCSNPPPVVLLAGLPAIGLMPPSCQLLATRCPTLFGLSGGGVDECSASIGIFDREEQLHTLAQDTRCGWLYDQDEQGERVVVLAVTSTQDPTIESIELTLAPRSPGRRVEQSSINLRVHYPAGLPREAGCIGDVATNECVASDDGPGVRYEVSNGICMGPLRWPNTTEVGHSVTSFALMSGCVPE